MSQHFASLKPGDVVEVKGYVISFAITTQDQNNTFHAYTFYNKCIVSFRPIEKFKYTPNMKKNIGMVSILASVVVQHHQFNIH